MMHYKYVIIFAGLLFAYVKAMEIDPDKQREARIAVDNISSAEAFDGVELSSYLTTKVIAKKLMKDIRAVANTDNQEESYKEYLESQELTEETSRLILKALIHNEPSLLWEILPFDIIEQNLGIEIRSIISLKNDQLLILYSEYSKINGRPISKIKIWDMKAKDWADIDFHLPDVFVYTWLISKDLKTLFLYGHDSLSWYCSKHLVLVYDLENKKPISSITLPDTLTSHYIKSVCTINEDKFVCCGMGDGKVDIFERKAEPVDSFEARTQDEIERFNSSNLNGVSFDTCLGQEIQLIDVLGDSLVTVNPHQLRAWKLDKNAESELKYLPINEMPNNYSIKDVKLGSNGDTILIHFTEPTSMVKVLTFPKLHELKSYTLKPSDRKCQRSQNGKIFTFIKKIKKSQFFVILDAETGNVIQKIKLDKDDDSYIKFNGLAIAADNSFIILYSKNGQITKINLNLDQDLGNVLAKIKNRLKKSVKF